MSWMQGNKMTCKTVGVLLLAFSGCGQSDRASVSGRVTLDGQPLQSGSITFFPTGNTKGPTAGDVIEGGIYSVSASRGPVAGQYRVEIRSMRKTGRKIRVPVPAPPGTMMDELVSGIPAIYNDESTLTAEVIKGKNHFDFDLKSKPD
jgi:hypothetical protein